MSEKTNKRKKPVIPEIPGYRTAFVCAVICAVFAGLFLARLHVEELKGRSLEVFASSSGYYADWFLYCKELFYVIIAAVICIYTLGERLFPDDPCKKNPLFTWKAVPVAFCTGSYLLLNVLSSLLSDNKEVTVWGICTEFEGSAAIFAYCVIFLFGVNFINGSQIAVFHRRALLTLFIAVAAVGIFEYITEPILQLPFMKYIIAPAEFREQAASLESANDFREVTLMFYNSNYTGSFLTIAFPLSAYYLMTARKPVLKAAAAVLSAAMLALAVMSNSTAAFYVCAAELVILAVYSLAKGVLHVKSAAVGLCAFAVLAAGVSLATDNAFMKTLLKNVSNKGSYSADENVYWLKSVSVENDSVHLVGRETDYYFTPPVDEGGSLTVRAGSGGAVVSEQLDSTTVRIHDVPTDSDINAAVSEGVLYIDCGYRTTLDFAVTTGGVKAIVQNAALISDIPTAPMADSPLVKYYGFATGRGYIWLNSIPLLKSCMFLGRGAGNFPFWFVQNDLAGLCVTNGTSHMIIDKPHSLYLQIAVTSGIAALLAVLVLFIGALFLGGREMLRAKKTLPDENSCFMLCLLTGCCGYMVISLVNDSVVTVAPFFWLEFGVLWGMILDRKETANG